MQDNFALKLLVNNDMWDRQPNFGFLTPTVLTGAPIANKRVIYGAVRDSLGQAVIRRVEISNQLDITPQEEICFDRRNSGGFDTNGTILGHAITIGDVVRLYYIGFRRTKRVKFEAYSGLAESNDDGKTFQFKQLILDKKYFTFLNGSPPDIVACHWNDLSLAGNGMALVAVGNGWLQKDNSTYPKYSSFLIKVENFQFRGVICKVPQKDEIYRLGRPRFLEDHGMTCAVLTGGRIDGDYRPYFFNFNGYQFSENLNLEFPIRPRPSGLFRQQVSYPELINFLDSSESIFLFNGDNMGIKGCYSLTTRGWWL